MKFGVVICLVGMFSMPAMAASAIDQADFANSGYGEVAALFASMNPEQQREVLAQAKLKQRELERLSPQELSALDDQMHVIAGTLKINAVDPAKLDPKKSKSTADIRNDFGAYQDKYSRHEVKNAIVRY